LKLCLDRTYLHYSCGTVIVMGMNHLKITRSYIPVGEERFDIQLFTHPLLLLVLNCSVSYK